MAHVKATTRRWLYGGKHPNRLASLLNRGTAAAAASGIGPKRLAMLEVRGRRTGRRLTFPVVVAEYQGQRYLVAMLGSQANWVRNIRAAGGEAVLQRGRCQAVHLEEVEPDLRPPILQRYLQVAPGARAHFPIDQHAPLERFEVIADQYPVFRLSAAVGRRRGGPLMRIEYLHASKYGNGAAVAAEFKRLMAAQGVDVSVHHIRETRPKALAPADLYLFSSPGRMGRPIGSMRRFLKKIELPGGTRYAILTTEAQPRPDKKTGRVPTEEELARWQRVRAIMNQILQGKGLVNVAEDKIYVTGLKGPLEDGWERKVQAFADRILVAAERADGARQAALAHQAV